MRGCGKVDADGGGDDGGRARGERDVGCCVVSV